VGGHLCGGDVYVPRDRERATMQEAPASIPSCCIDHLADLVVM
jgi:hypothetical protein